MKKQIYQFKKLANSCQEFAKKVNMKTNAFSEFKFHNDHSKSISIYCGSDHEIVSVYFKDEMNLKRVEVTLYNDTITFPMSMTLDEMNQLFDDCFKIVQNGFPSEIEKYEFEKEMIIKSKIQKLEDELKILKS